MPMLVVRQVFVTGERSSGRYESKILRTVLFGLRRWCLALSFWER